MHNTRIAVLGICLLVLSSLAQAASEQEQKAIGIVDKVVAMAASDGMDKTVAAVSDPKGPFTDGEYYAYIIKNDGFMLAHGANPGLVGKNMIDLRDSDGVMLIKLQIDQAKTGPGWIEYKWTNPQTRKLQNKASYVRLIPGQDAMVGCGIYK